MSNASPGYFIEKPVSIEYLIKRLLGELDKQYNDNTAILAVMMSGLSKIE